MLPASISRIADRYKTHSATVDHGRSHEAHDLRSLSARLLLSPQDTLEQVAVGNLLALDSRNGKFLFSARSLDSLRNRVVEFVAGEIVEEMGARGADGDRIVFALERAFARQFDLSRSRGENVVEFARTPSDDQDDDDTLRNGALLAGGAAAGYGAYRYLKGRNGTSGNALPGSGNGQPQLPGGPKPRDPNGSAEGVSDGVERHPGASMPVPITTASSTTRKTVGNQVIDPLASAVVNGRKAIAKRGSAIWSALRNLPIE